MTITSATSLDVGSRTDGTNLEGQDELAYSITTDGRHKNQTIAFQQNTRNEIRKMGGDGDIAGALSAQPGMKQQTYIAFGANNHGLRDVSTSLSSKNERLDGDTETFVVTKLGS